MSKKYKLFYKRQLHGQRNMRKGSKNGKRLALKWDALNLRPLSKQNLYPKSLYLKRPWNSNLPSSHVMESK
jgi:hypothetical protein